MTRSTERWFSWKIVAGVIVLALVVLTSPSRAQTPAEQELAQKYAPYIGLKPQEAPCDRDGERFRPVSVDVVLGQANVTLRGPDGEEVKQAPTASDLYNLGSDYNLDFPGTSTNPGCDYEEWFREIAEGVPTTVYAHVIAEPDHPGLLALQYWLYWPFNQWNNTHESDWEMVQLVFEAGSAEEALAKDPLDIGYSQHEGAERAEWDDDKLEKREGRPVIRPATGSHANFFNESLYLGYGPSTGFGCDDTREQDDVQQAEVILLPTEPSGPDDPNAWLTFEGRWGELHRGSFSGPIGPMAKERWLEPMTWREEKWRDSSITVTGQEPGKGVVPLVSDVFCAVVESGSKIFVNFLREPIIIGAILGAVVVSSVAAGRRTRWHPVVPIPINQRRDAGQMFTTAAHLYRRGAKVYIGVGLMFLVFGGVGAVIQNLMMEFTPLGTLIDIVDSDPLVASVMALTSAGLSTLAASVLVYAAATRATVYIDEGGTPSPLTIYKDVFDSIWDLLMVAVRVGVVVALLTITIVGIPIAIFYLVRRALANQSVMIEGLDSRAALVRSRDLVTGHELRTLVVATLTNVVVFIAGPVIGMVALVIWSPSLLFVNILSGLIYTILVPYAGIVLTLLFCDLRLEHEAPAVRQ